MLHTPRRVGRIVVAAWWMETYDKVRAKASSVDLCFPGHDAGMLFNYPKVAEDVTRLA
jgi:hypothetical protein